MPNFEKVFPWMSTGLLRRNDVRHSYLGHVDDNYQVTASIN